MKIGSSNNNKINLSKIVKNKGNKIEKSEEVAEPTRSEENQKLEEIRMKIQNGDRKIDYELIADKMLGLNF